MEGYTTANRILAVGVDARRVGGACEPTLGELGLRRIADAQGQREALSVSTQSK
jgi:hypothetical protein